MPDRMTHDGRKISFEVRNQATSDEENQHACESCSKQACELQRAFDRPAEGRAGSLDEGGDEGVS